MRSVHLILTLGATLVVGVPIKPRQFDFGDPGDFGGFGNSIEDGFSSTIGGGSLEGIDGLNIADNTITGGDLGGLTSFESIDVNPPIDNSALAENLYVDPQPQVVADIVPTDPGLGAVGNGDLIAAAPTNPNTNQISPNGGTTISFDSNTPIPEFTPTGSDVIGSLENLNPADIASSSVAPVTPDPAPVPVPVPVPAAVAATPDPAPVTPNPGAFSLIPGYTLTEFQASEQGTLHLDALQNAFEGSLLIGFIGPAAAGTDGLSIQGFVAAPVALGADTALTPNLPLINTPVAFTPSDTPVAATLPDLTPPAVQIASTDGSIGTGTQLPNLQQFKDQAAKLAADPSLTPAERATWQNVDEVAGNLSPADFGKLTLNTDFTTPTKAADGSTVPGDTVGSLTPQAQTALQRAQLPQAYRTNGGINLGTSILSTASQGFVQAGVRILSLLGEKSILQNSGTQIYTVVQRVGVPVSVAVPVTQRVGVAVPVTVVQTLAGGVVTRILVYRPNPVAAAATTTSGAARVAAVKTTGAAVVAARPTGTPKAAGAKVAKSKRQIKEASGPDTAAEAHAVPESVEAPPEGKEVAYAYGGEADFPPEAPAAIEDAGKKVAYAYGKEAVFAPEAPPAMEDAADKGSDDVTFKYQPGDYSAFDGGDRHRHPPPGSSDERLYPRRNGGSVGAVVPKPKS